MAGPLTVADDSGATQLETSLFAEGLYRRYGVDFRGFEAAELERKLDAFRAQSGMDTISAVQGRVLHDLAFAVRVMIGSVLKRAILRIARIVS